MSIPSAAVPSWHWKASQGLFGERIRGFLNVISPGHRVPKTLHLGEQEHWDKGEPQYLSKGTPAAGPWISPPSLEGLAIQSQPVSLENPNGAQSQDTSLGYPGKEHPMWCPGQCTVWLQERDLVPSAIPMSRLRVPGMAGHRAGM